MFDGFLKSSKQMDVESERGIKLFERLYGFTERVTKSFEEIDDCFYQTGDQVVRTDECFYQMGDQVVRTDECFYQTGIQVVQTVGRFYRTGDQAVQTDATFFERMTQVIRTRTANGFQTACKRNSVRKRKAVSVCFPVKGHICMLWSLNLIFVLVCFVYLREGGAFTSKTPNCRGPIQAAFTRTRFHL